MPVARITRKMAETVAKEYVRREDRDMLFDTKLRWQDDMEISIMPGIDIIKVRAGGRYGDERHEYYVKAGDRDHAEEILGTVCERSMFRCMRWMPT